MPYVVIAGFFIITSEEIDMGQNSGSQGSGDKKAGLTLQQGANEVSGYMVASGEGKMACQIGDVVVEGDYEGNEGDPCTANITVQ